MWWKLRGSLIVLAICLLLTSFGCSSVPDFREVRPVEVLPLNLDQWQTDGVDVFLPHQDLRDLLANRARWIAYAKLYEPATRVEEEKE